MISGSFDVFACLICLQVHRFTIKAVFHVSTVFMEGLHPLSFTHLFWIWTIQTRGTTFVHKRCNIPDNSKLPKKRYEVGKERRVAFFLDLVHNDVSIPVPTTSTNGSKYFLTFIDDESRYCWIYFPKQKSELFETFKNFKSLPENTLRKKIKATRSDNGGEYDKREL